MVIVKSKKRLFYSENCWFCNRPRLKDIFKYSAFMQCSHTKDIVGFKKIYFYTKIIDLGQDDEEILKRFRKNTRYKISRAIREGFKMQIEKDLGRFIDFFNASAGIKNLENLTRSYLESFGENLIVTKAVHENRTLVMHAYIIDRLIKRARLLHSILLFLSHDNSSERNMIGRANRFLHFKDMLFFKNLRMREYDLGGYAEGTNDEKRKRINEFKDSFGGKLVFEPHFIPYPFFILQKIKLFVKDNWAAMLNRDPFLHIYFFFQAKWNAFVKNLKTENKLKHLIFLIADHFEPADYGPDNMKFYFENYKKLAVAHNDSHRNHPKLTWFYRGEDRKVIGLLNDMARQGLGEPELHIHHGAGTEHEDINTGERLKDMIYSVLSVLRAPAASKERRYGFVHGMWALDNSRGGKYCGINDELIVLRETGCFADFTFPAWGPMQPAKINSIFYAKDNPKRPKSYNTGIDVAVGASPLGDLMIFEGPQNSTLEILLCKKNLNMRLVDSWIRAHIGVVGRDEWIFVKTNIHSLGTRYRELIFNQKIINDLFNYLEGKFNDGKKYKLHYVTAREAYNIVKAAEDGKEGDPARYKNYLIPPYAGAAGDEHGMREDARKINIAFLVDDLNSLYGTTRNLLENIKWIDRGRFRPFIYVLDSSAVERNFNSFDDIQIKRIYFNKFNPLSYIRIINFLKSDGIDIIHTYPFVSNLIGPLLARIGGVKKIVASLHSEAVYRRKFLLRSSLDLADKVIVVSEYLKSFLHKHFSLPEDKIKKVYSGIDLELFKTSVDGGISRERIGVSDKDLVIMTVAKFRWEKGHEYLVRAMGKIKGVKDNFRFVFIGDGLLERKIRSLAKDLGVEDKIIFMGYRDNVNEMLSLCDIFILPSVSEGFGIALLEAMAMKKPIIATTVGGIKESVKDGENGFLVNSADPDAILSALYKLAENRPLRELMGICGRQMVEENFNARDRIKDLEKIYVDSLSS